MGIQKIWGIYCDICNNAIDYTHGKKPSFEDIKKMKISTHGNKVFCSSICFENHCTQNKTISSLE